jgi:topoisomerase-4 subunit A
MKTLIKKEIREDAAKYGDARRSRLIDRAPAQALDETALIPSEPMTIVLSRNGWVRVAKGHEIDPEEMNYKSGDEFAMAARGRSNQLTVFIDSTGKTYALPTHSLPSARGQGEPLSGRLKPADGARFVGVMAGDPEQRFLLASDSGYGFAVRLGDMYTRNKAGKATLSVPKGAGVLAPVPVRSLEDDWIVAVTTEGYMLVIALAELPQMTRGKGIKIINIPSARLKSREEYVAAMQCIQDGEKLTVYAGKKHKTMKPAEVDEFAGERGRRGRKLPRGYQKVDSISVDEKS